MRVDIITDFDEYEVNIERMTRLETILKGQGIPCPFICDGTGTCGKCQVRFLSEPPKPTRIEKALLGPRLLNKGYRLACEVIIIKDSKIYIPSEKKIQSVNLFDTEAIGERAKIRHEKVINAGKNFFEAVHEEAESIFDNKNYGIAIDLGTTSIAVELVDRNNGEVVYATTCANHQSVYGADVVTRIDSAIRGKQDILCELVRRDIVNAINEIVSHFDLDKNDELPIVLSGNTAMIHMLCGMSCIGLAAYPFEPVDLGTQLINIPKDVDLIEADIKTAGADTMIQNEDVYLVKTFPGISSYIGGDTVSAIYALGIDRPDEVNVLIDLGTNGEMVVSNRGNIKVASIAMGPAFEGGNISCGTPSISGAINSVSIKNGFCKVKTIDNAYAIGVCGSGVIEAVYEFFANGIIDEHGTYKSEYSRGYPLCQLNQRQTIVFTQDDVRQLQLAKAAIRASIDVLLNEANIAYSEVDNVYLAGGFGYDLDLNKLIGIGAIPLAWKNKIVAVGNASLEGSRQYLIEHDDERLNFIINNAKEVLLSQTESFQDMYLDNVLFEEK